MLFFGLFILFSILAMCIIQINEDSDTPLGFTIFLVVAALIGFGFVIGAFKTIPTALDVYQGKTELRIIYEGQIPVDTTVIYKK